MAQSSYLALGFINADHIGQVRPLRAGYYMTVSSSL
jgi:hypothetical protein